jgi:hypothetical protein
MPPQAMVSHREIRPKCRLVKRRILWEGKKTGPDGELAAGPGENKEVKNSPLDVYLLILTCPISSAMIVTNLKLRLP